MIAKNAIGVNEKLSDDLKYSIISRIFAPLDAIRLTEAISLDNFPPEVW